jgi:FkbM family methyltransferase
MKYSQNNEQTIISNYFQGKIGRFLDIGAYDGIALSNVYALVLDGWSGVMIEGSPMTFELLKKNITQESVTLIHALVDVEESREVTFFDNTEATATMNIGNYEKWLKATPFHECTMMTTPISEILDEHGYAYDLVSIDVEGGSADLFKWMSARMPDVRVWVVEHDGQDLQLEGYKVLDRNGENLIFGKIV